MALWLLPHSLILSLNFKRHVHAPPFPIHNTTTYSALLDIWLYGQLSFIGFASFTENTFVGVSHQMGIVKTKPVFAMVISFRASPSFPLALILTILDDSFGKAYSFVSTHMPNGSLKALKTLFVQILISEPIALFHVHFP